MDEILKTCKAELTNGVVKKRHPFHYFSFATMHDTVPKQRTVVLRKFSPDFSLLIYTDLRSEKVEDIKQNNKVSALFYHPKKLLQIRLEGTATLINDEIVLHQHWKNIPENSKKDYITTLKPGTPIDDVTKIHYDMEHPNFTMISIQAEKIEYLQLARPNHIRRLFIKKENQWISHALIP